MAAKCIIWHLRVSKTFSSAAIFSLFHIREENTIPFNCLTWYRWFNGRESTTNRLAKRQQRIYMFNILFSILVLFKMTLYSAPIIGWLNDYRMNTHRHVNADTFIWTMCYCSVLVNVIIQSRFRIMDVVRLNVIMLKTMYTVQRRVSMSARYLYT